MSPSPSKIDIFESSHLQIQFFTKEKRFSNHLSNEIINVPASSEPEHLNLLINKISEATDNRNWEAFNFDFLIHSILLRTTLQEFIQTYKLSSEEVIKVECIQLTPTPRPQFDLEEAEWVADLKIFNSNCIFSINYGGHLNIWSGVNKKLEKTFTRKLDDDPLKCLDVFRRKDEIFAIVGKQNQTLILFKVDIVDGNKEGSFELRPQAVLRGHQRSVECLAASSDGTRAISGSFDKCVKVWDIEQQPADFEGPSETMRVNSSNVSKKSRFQVATKTPMVTLEAHHDAVVALAWNPLNPGQALSVSWDHQILLLDLHLACPVTSLLSNKAFTSLAVNPQNGLALTGSTDPLIRLWDTRSKEGSMVKSTFSGHLGWVSDLCWSPDREHLFISSSFDKTVKMWDTRSQKSALYDLMGHEDRALCVDWGIPGMVASGSVDCSIKVFAC